MSSEENWHVVIRARNGRVSILKNLTREVAEETAHALAPLPETMMDGEDLLRRYPTKDEPAEIHVLGPDDAGAIRAKLIERLD